LGIKVGLENAIEVSHLTKRFGNLTAVNDLTFSVKKGEIFGFLGPNGAGKTTTIRMLTGLTKPTAGSAVIEGFDIEKQIVKAKGQIGVVPEVSNIYDEMNAWDNLIFAAQLYGVPKNERDQRAKGLLERFGLYDRCHDRVGTFSKGMKRRVTIAMALIHNPPLLFLDEPTTGLDVQSARVIRALIKELNENGTTIFMTTHYIEEAGQFCQRIAIINQGRIAAIDSPERLEASLEEQPTIEVAFEAGENIKNKLQTLSGVVSVSDVGDKFRVAVENVSEAVPLMADFARKNSLKIICINTLKPSLEDAFVRLTGLNLEVMTKEKEAKSRGASTG
jgi:ABC-2 type transport system ATP-binding protein